MKLAELVKIKNKIIERKIFMLPLLAIVIGLAVGCSLVEGTDVETHSGDLVIEGDDVYTIENKELIVDGNIFVSDNAKLIIKNSKVSIDNHFKNQYRVELYDDAQAVIEGSTLVDLYEYGPELSFHANDGSRIEMKDTKSDWWVDIHEEAQGSIENSDLFYLVWRGESARLDVKDSTIRYVVRLTLKGEEKESVTLEGLKAGLITDFHFSFSDGGYITLANTRVRGGWNICFEEHQTGETIKTVLIKDSQIKEYWPELSGERVKIDGLKPSHFARWNMYEDLELSDRHKMDVTLENTSVEFWKLVIGAKETEIKNSHIGCLDAWGEYELSRFTVEDTTIENFFSYDYAETTLRNSLVTANMRLVRSEQNTGECFGRVTGDGATIKPGLFEIAECRGELKGDFEFGHRVNLNWQEATVEREYPINVSGEGGNPLAGVSVKLIDSSGGIIQEATTDQEGKTILTLTFNDDNYRSSWRAQVEVEGSTFSKEIGFLTDTPAVIGPGAEARERVWFLVAGGIGLLVVAGVLILIYLRQARRE